MNYFNIETTKYIHRLLAQILDKYIVLLLTNIQYSIKIGNPGIDTYYEHYMEKVANKMPTQEVANIICISYAGHINPSKCEVYFF